MIRTGLGYDIHRLKRGRRFLLGGVEIPAQKGELGHSDGDVLAHAVCDALLGAAALGDIGELFPPGRQGCRLLSFPEFFRRKNPGFQIRKEADLKYKGADSMKLLRDVFLRVKEAGWTLVNLDCVIICEKPKVLPHRDSIRASLASALETSSDNVFVKGKTAEGLGETGKVNAAEAIVICLLEKTKK